MVKFNKATATELIYPEFMRMLIDAPNKRVAVQVCTEKARNAVAFSKGEGKQTYAITVKVPAIVVAIRKLLPDLAGSDSLTFRGKLFAEDKAIIYDITAGEPLKKRRKRKTDEDAVEESDQDAEISESPAEEPEAAESDSGKKEKTAETKPKRCRRKKQ